MIICKVLVLTRSLKKVFSTVRSYVHASSSCSQVAKTQDLTVFVLRTLIIIIIKISVWKLGNTFVIIIIYLFFVSDFLRVTQTCKHEVEPSWNPRLFQLLIKFFCFQQEISQNFLLIFFNNFNYR